MELGLNERLNGVQHRAIDVVEQIQRGKQHQGCPRIELGFGHGKVEYSMPIRCLSAFRTQNGNRKSIRSGLTSYRLGLETTSTAPNYTRTGHSMTFGSP